MTPTVTIKPGERGIAVRQLQLLLNSELVPTPRLRPDGDFGPRTAAAVARFQVEKRLPERGVVGPLTWSALGMDSVAAAVPVDTGDVKAWMPIALAERGIVEDSRPRKHTARILEYHRTTTLRATTDETPWCSSFVNWVMTQAGYRGANSAAGKSWFTWGKALPSPRYGAIAVLKKKGATSDASTGSATGFHVAFYLESSATHVHLLGGNQLNQVRKSKYALSAWEVKGYRWPA